MGFACEMWINETDKAIGKFEFDTVPRAGETISLPNEAGDKYDHFKVEHVTHRAHGPQENRTTFVFVAKAV